jgi:hypothetical protein
VYPTAFEGIGASPFVQFALSTGLAIIVALIGAVSSVAKKEN